MSTIRMACLAVAGVLSACGTARRGEPMSGGPLRIATEDVRDGERVFMAACDKCHPGGETGLGPAINNKPLPSFLIRFQVRNGLGAMPDFPEDVISGPELDHLLEYLDALRDAPTAPSRR
jgi:mono/diheme cytochrome c family protein